jgi:hypothetical protein
MCGSGACLRGNPHIYPSPESSHCSCFQGAAVAPWSRSDPGHMWASSDCITDPPHSPPVPHSLLCRRSTPVHARPWRCSLKSTSRATSVCTLRLPVLGCMRKRRTLLNLLHKYWSRFPSLLPVTHVSSAPQHSSSLPICGTR